MKIGPLFFFLALLLLPPLLSALGRWLQQQMAQAGGGEELDEPPPHPGRDHGEQIPRPRALRPVLAPAAVTVAPAAVTVAPAHPPVPVPAPPRRAMMEGLGSPRDLRHSIVVAAVLGPCRALDPQ